MGILEKIQEVEREIARTQKNKGMSLKGSIVLHCTKQIIWLIDITSYILGSQLVNSCMLFCYYK